MAAGGALPLLPPGAVSEEISQKQKDELRGSCWLWVLVDTVCRSCYAKNLFVAMKAVRRHNNKHDFGAFM